MTDEDYSDMYLDSVKEPIPAEHQSSLMINNRIIFDEVLPSTNNGSWRLVGVNDGEKRCSEFTTATVVAKVSLDRLKYTEKFLLGT